MIGSAPTSSMPSITSRAMVAHLVFTAIDPKRPASVSPVLADLIRGDLAYDGVLITDCLSMEALRGTPAQRVSAALGAGYDVALMSQGGLEASRSAAEGARPLSPETLERIARAERKRGNLRVDVTALHGEVERILRENGLA
jgi:beta-N-acetylhexosaminidase